MNQWDATDIMPYFVGTPPHVIIFSAVERIWCGKVALRDNVVLKMIEDSDRRGSLSDFNLNQIMEVLSGFI